MLSRLQCSSKICQHVGLVLGGGLLDGKWKFHQLRERNELGPVARHLGVAKVATH